MKQKIVRFNDNLNDENYNSVKWYTDQGWVIKQISACSSEYSGERIFVLMEKYEKEDKPTI